ncbi:MAG: ADP-ribosylglycohydrolase family protein, partial [Verrucomicrobia bacterium]|nr:ADP-ribosylglycohydrolase family protein [Verrucomicrobiota bacterium]
MKKRNNNAHHRVKLTLKDRIEGCLLGAAIGAELAWLRQTRPDAVLVADAAELLHLILTPTSPAEERQYLKSRPYALHGICPKLTPLIDLGVRVYLNKGGRVTPEDFGAELRASRGFVSPPSTWWMQIHAIQELLHEGCHPRLSGLGAFPSSLMVNAMPAVGIFHHGDPEYAYLDGVELASVSQPRLGADWAGLAAAAIAAAFDPGNEPEAILRAVFTLAQENNPEIFNELNHCVRSTAGWFTGKNRVEQIDRWLKGFPQYRPDPNGLAPNPLRFVLPLLKPLDREPQFLMAMLIALPRLYGPGERIGAPILAGAILGARHGRAIFPADWLGVAERIAKPWFSIVPVVAKRHQQEKAIIAVHETLLRRKPNGNSLLEDKIHGCLLASSIGNAMGSPVEGWSWEEIDAKYPGGIQTILKPECLESEDDNQQMILLLETYLSRAGRPVMARHLARTWCDQWHRANLFPYIDKNSYDLIRAGWDPRITGHWNVGGTSVMCIEPVGLYHLADPDYVVVDVPAIAYMHVRGVEIAAASVLATAVAEAMRPDATVDRVCNAALNAAPRTRPAMPDQFRTVDGRRFPSCYAYLETCLTVAAKYDDVFAARKELYAKCLLYYWWRS